MATVYKIKIETTSPWCNYNEGTIEDLFYDFLYNNGFESTIVNIIRRQVR